MTIPIPRRNKDVVALLADLEDEIDRAVYDLFDLTNERTVIEEYLEVF